MSYIGSTPQSQSFISGTDYFNGTGSQTAFTLTRAVNSVNDIEVVINNVVQQPNTAYTVLGNVITFTSAPSAGTANIYVRYLSTTTQTIAPSPATVQYSSLNSDNQSKLGISFKNRLINPGMAIDQRNVGASVSLPSGGGYNYGSDRWYVENNTDGTATLQQVTDAPTGFSNSIKYTVTATDSSLTSDQAVFIQQRIEGFNSSDLAFGTVNAQTVTLSFWVKSSLTGTFSGALANNAYNRGYPFTFTINSANVWEQKSVIITGDNTGTWVGATNGVGIRVTFCLAAGSARVSTAGTWAAYVGLGATGTTNIMATNGATFQVTGTQFEVGTQATTFDYRSYGTELALAQRYYQKSYNQDTVPGTATAFGAPTLRCTNNSSLVGYFQWTTALKVTMRTTPSNTYYSTSTGASGKCRFVTSAIDVTISDGGERGDAYISPYTNGTAATNEGIQFQFTASAEL